MINAIGPETFTYRGLVEEIGRSSAGRGRSSPVPPWFGYAVEQGAGPDRGRRDCHAGTKIRGLMAGLLCVDAPAAERPP